MWEEYALPCAVIHLTSAMDNFLFQERQNLPQSAPMSVHVLLCNPIAKIESSIIGSTHMFLSCSPLKLCLHTASSVSNVYTPHLRLGLLSSELRNMKYTLKRYL